MRIFATELTKGMKIRSISLTNNGANRFDSALRGMFLCCTFCMIALIRYAALNYPLSFGPLCLTFSFTSWPQTLHQTHQ